MLKKARVLISDNLLRSSGLMFCAFMIASVFNYLYQIVMGRLLGPGQYGLLNALLSLFTILGVPISTLLMVVASRAADFKARNDHIGISDFFVQVNKKVLRAGCVGLFIFLLCTPITSSYFRAPSLLPVILLGLAAFFSLFSPINTAMLQGLQNYKWLGITMALAGPANLLFSAIPVLAGFGANGAIAGIMATAVFTWWITFTPLKINISASVSWQRAGGLKFPQIMPVFIANLAFAAMTQADVVLANRYFSSHDAGLYAAAAIFGRVVMYIPGSIVLAMFPMVSEATALNKSGAHLLLKALLVTFVLSGSAAVLFFLFPNWIITAFLGADYADASSLLKYFGFAMLPMAFLLVFMNYFIAREKKMFSYVMAACAILEIATMHLYHAAPLDIVKALSAAGVLALIGGGGAQFISNLPSFRGKNAQTVGVQ